MPLLPPVPTTNLPVRQFRHGSDVTQAITIGDLRAMALRRLPRFSAEYVEGGAEDEATLAQNRAAFAARRFRPRVLRGVTRPVLDASLLGKRAAMPLAVAPTGLNGLLWPNADLALARAAAGTGVPFSQSTVSNALIGDVAAVPGLRHWMQLYLYRPDATWEALIERARTAGCEALLVTVDTPVLGNREWDRRSYGAPMALSLASKLDILRHPGWLAQVIRHGFPRFLNLEEFVPEKDRTLFATGRWAVGNEAPDLDWQKLAVIRRAWPGKLLIKGVQHADDLRLALKADVDGVVLSNHGGRQLDRVGAPLELIAEARAIAGPNFAILADSGFRRGTDVVQALALGADGVLVGRAMLYGVAAGGEAGAARALAILREEITRTLVLLGLTSVDELSPAIFEA